MTSAHEETLTTLLPTILLIYTLGIITIESKLCFESLPTVQKVTHCPKNYTELRFAVQRKRCDALAKTQTCVPDPNEFVYHCLVNQQNDGFVEVCAPKWKLAGYCGFYDTQLNKIDQNIRRDCTLFENPCPSIFNSSDSYKYQGCYEVIRQKIQGPKAGDEKRQAHSSPLVQHIVWIVPSIVAIGFIVAFTIVCLKMRKINKESGQSTEEEDGDELNTVERESCYSIETDRNENDMNARNLQRGQSIKATNCNENKDISEGASYRSIETGQSTKATNDIENEDIAERESCCSDETDYVHETQSTQKMNVFCSTYTEDMPLSAPRLNKSVSTQSEDMPLSAPRLNKSVSTQSEDMPSSTSRLNKSGSTQSEDLLGLTPRMNKYGSTQSDNISASKLRKSSSRCSEDIPLSTPRLKKSGSTQSETAPSKSKLIGSTHSDKTFNSSQRKKQSHSTSSDFSLKRTGAIKNHSLKHSTSEPNHSSKGKTEETHRDKPMKQISFERDYNDASGGDTSENCEEEELISSSKSIHSSEGKRKRRNRRKRRKGKRN